MKLIKKLTEDINRIANFLEKASFNIQNYQKYEERLSNLEMQVAKIREIFLTTTPTNEEKPNKIARKILKRRRFI